LNILVTGGAGYIGSHVVKQLIEKTKHNVVILDNLSTGLRRTVDTLFDIRDGRGNNLKFINADLTNFDIIEGIFKSLRIDAVMHFAAKIVVPESVENPIDYYVNNTSATINLLKMCRDYGVRKFIFSSTAAVYGEPPLDAIPVSEDYVPSPINPYGRSKLMDEEVIRDLAFSNKEFKYIIFRYFNVAGADPEGRIGQSTPNATHLIKVAAQAALGKRDKLLVFGTDYPTQDGTCIRDYIHVDDLADAHILALDYLKTHDSDMFNCGYGHGYSVLEVIRAMKEVSGADFKVEYAPRRKGDPAVLIADNRKIIKKMNWKPKYDDIRFICKTALDWERKL
jgi:UDP-glucose 4-epimerase